MQMYGMSGELLGPIGHNLEGQSQGLPAWKQDFLSKPSVSVRKGIAWGYKLPYEDTDTLAMTADSGRFIDIRFPKAVMNDREAVQHPSFWAFTGQASTTFYDANTQQHAVDMPYTAHCKFVHEIDSRGPQSIAAGDEGDMFTLGNGDCMEMGMMVNPASGRKELYKEYWCGADVLPRSDGVDDSKVCLVAETCNSTNTQGFLIRIGGRVQGIISSTDSGASRAVGVERWARGGISCGKPVREVGKHSPDATWTRDDRSSARLPCSWLCTSEQQQVGDSIEHNGIMWQIIEVHR